MIITEELLRSFRTNRNGFTQVTTLILSGVLTPKKGWLKESIGKELSEENYKKIMQDTERRNNKNNLRIQRCAKEKKKKVFKKNKKQNNEYKIYPSEYVNSDAFLASYEWRVLRMRVLKKYGARCQCCGATPDDGVRMHVDHIKPRKIYPHLALNEDNLQVLCEECNHGKSNWDMTDWRGELEVAKIVKEIIS